MLAEPGRRGLSQRSSVNNTFLNHPRLYSLPPVRGRAGERGMNALLTPSPCPSPLKEEGMPPMHGRIRHMTPSPRAGEGWGEGDERPVNTLSLSLSPQGRGNATHARAYPSHDSLPPCGGRLGRGG